MAVNRSYWSGSETKSVYGIDVELPLFPVNSKTVGSYPYFANSFVAKTKDKGVDWTQPIDASYSFCKTDNNYCGCKSVAVCGYSTSYKPVAQRGRQYNIDIDSFDIGLGIKSGLASTADSYIQYTTSSASTLQCTTIPNTNTENKKPDTLTYNSETFYKFNKNFAPILKVNPHDYMLVIMIDCAKLKDDKTLSDFKTDGNSIFNSTAKCDLKTYLLYYYEQGYTIITGVWCFVVASPANITQTGSNIAPVLYSTDIIDIDYTGSDGNAYTFSAKLPSMLNMFGGANFKYTNDSETVIAGSFSLQDNIRFGEIVIAGTLNGGNTYISYPYQLGLVHVGDYFKIYETTNKNYLLTAATVNDFGGLDAFREWCRKQTAYFGLPFRENRDFTNVDDALIDERIMWGIIDSGGITHGEYTIGIGNLKNPLYNSNNLQNDSGWKPSGGGPTSGGDKDKEKSEYGGAAFGGWNINVFDFGLNRYIVDRVGYGVLEQFYKQCLDYDAARKRFIAGAMNEGASAADAAKYWEDRFKDRAEYQAKMYSELGYGSDPRNNMVSVMALPFDHTTIPPLDTTGVSPKVGYNTMATKFTSELAVGAGTVTDIQYAPGTFGPTPQTDLFQTKFLQPKYDVFVVNMGEITVTHPKDWNDFRASEPYSRCELYIPYHGNIALNLNQVLGKKIKVQLHIDLLSGSSYAVVTCNGALYQALPGQVGFQMPFTIEGSTTNASALADLSAQSQTNKLQSSNNLLNGVINTVGAMADVNPGSALSSIIGTFQSAKQLGINERTINFNLVHACDGKSVANATTPITAMSAEGSCQLIWHYPLMLAYNDTQYANLVGYACQRTGTLSSFKGYTQCNNANLSKLSCTEEEKGMILAQLQNGVVIV